MADPLARKLEGLVRLSEDEKAAISTLQSRIVVRRAGTDLIRDGDKPVHVHVLIEGWGYRYKLLPEGGRQIMAYLIPGDLCDINIFILKRMDHSIGLLSNARVALVTEREMLDVMDRFPRIARALFWATLVDEATLRAWLTNTLRREPFERLAHLFCEMWLRMRAADLVGHGNSFDLPFNQAELGDTMGLNAVTVNRVLKRLREDALITLTGGHLTILDIERLRAVSGFDPNYLHFDAFESGKHGDILKHNGNSNSGGEL